MNGRMWIALGGAAVGGVLIGIAPNSDSAIAKAGADIAATLNASGIASGVVDWGKLPLEAPRQGPADPMDGPIVVVVGAK